MLFSLTTTTTLLLASTAVTASPLFPRQQQANTTSVAGGNTTTTTPAAAKANITAATVYLPLSTNGTSTTTGNTSLVPVHGYTNTQYNVSSFLGIPFATSERFRAPVLSVYNATGLNATSHGVACMQSPGAGRSLLNGTYTSRGVGEDCLSVDVYTPAGAGNGTKLPVMVWCEYEFHFQLSARAADFSQRSRFPMPIAFS